MGPLMNPLQLKVENCYKRKKMYKNSYGGDKNILKYFPIFPF